MIKQEMKKFNFEKKTNIGCYGSRNQPETTESRVHLYNLFAKYRLAQKSVHLKHSVELMEMFRFEPGSQFAERYHSVANCSTNMEDVISNNFFPH
jgi:hypothetical protein